MFQSTPVITDGRTGALCLPSRACCKFQSTPVITDGRTNLVRVVGGRDFRFNPRPSSLTGERRAKQHQAAQNSVSIHARHH